jgi:hypothetical protein
MHNLLKRNLANGLPDFPGFSLSGRIPVREEVINQLTDEFLRNNAEPDELSPAKDSGDAVAIANILRLVKKAVIHADAGVVTFEIEVRA